jgi:hypothetical protein
VTETIDKLGFWKWAYSDFLSNSLRGILAEFIVGSALGCLGQQRKEWDAYDLLCSGKKIEVKSAAYLQTWEQKEHSIIRFDIAEKSSWYASDNKYADRVERPADFYVFCVFSETNKDIANPLDVEQWFFLVMSKEQISQHFTKNKTVGLGAIEAAGIKRVRYPELKALFD